jgi:hypothetical protein
MSTTVSQWLGRSLAVAATAALLTGCGDQAPLGPERRPEARAAAAEASSPDGIRGADLSACPNLEVPPGNTLSLHVHASGVQLYRWDGAQWAFVAPLAVLYADPRGYGVVGTHFAGPTWKSVSGSQVVGAVLQRCTPDPTHIPWLLLGAVSSEGPGIFRRTTFIQRVNTVGGNAPAAPGSFVGEQVGVPYRTEYLFYKAR